uniref:Ig-like domain-containing protein n=1 Tax=Vespula pensylvanica TaxID=30213 RepID=A0A834NSK0_VESPE|nr:hypothetical protein H0235_011649 [Vespula pensylvanica]
MMTTSTTTIDVDDDDDDDDVVVGDNDVGSHWYYTKMTGEGAQYFRFKPRNSSVLERGEVIIPCEVENRVGIVQWVKDGFAYVVQPMSGQIVGHPRLRLIGDQNAGVYNLQITDASLTDDGEYQCQVGPHVRVKPIRANAHLTVICNDSSSSSSSSDSSSSDGDK